MIQVCGKTKKLGVLLFFCTGGGVIVCYLLLLGIYTRISDDPIIFFASLLISLLLSVAAGILLFFFGKRHGTFDAFTAGLSATVYFLGLVILAVFGPVFIDRSISYHIAFYATEQERIAIDDMRDEFSYQIFEKRIHDAIATGFIVENEDGTYSPSAKAKIMTAILLPLGKATNSLGTYETMKEEVKK